ncbi:MAG: Ig-like domain-containing protein [Pseudomonadota bacterium]
MGRVREQTVFGVLLGDQRTDQLLLLRDLDGDGTSASPGEITVFFDETNASGLPSPTANLFNVTQASDKAVYAADGSSDTVYRLVDANNDGDAQDAGEARVWFSAANASGLTLPTPNGIAEGSDGAIYIVNAGTGSAPADAVYRTVDLNGDGDAEDAGEASLWLDLQSVIPNSSAFDIAFIGDVAFVNDSAGGDPNVVLRIEDVDGSGGITPDEVTTFISEDMSFGAPVDFGNAVSVDGSLLVLTTIAGPGPISLYSLTDLDGSGSIDDAAEAVELWNASTVTAIPEPFVSFSVAADEDGNISLTADSSVISLTDLNGDGDYLDAGETTAIASEDLGDPIDRPRAVAYYEGAPQPAAASLGTGNQFSVFLDADSNTLFATGANFFGQLGNGVQGFNIEQPRAVVLPEGFDETITSVAVGQIQATFLTDSGDVYSWGFNNRGPLGLGDEEIRTAPVKIPGALDEETVVGIENGNGVSFAITDTGALYAWGSNTNGQLGLGDQEERLVPTRVQALADETVVAVSSGTSFTLALTADGQVFGFGRNSDGQLGAPDGLDADGAPLTRVLSPVLTVGLPDDIVAISADTNTAYAVTSDGRVYGWGESRFGQLLQGADQGDGTFVADGADVLVPIELTALPPNVVDVQGGARFGVALTAEGDVFLWGPNDEGPSGGLDGDPAFESDVTFFPTKLAQLDDVMVVEIAVGPNAVFARADDGTLFSFGINGDGRLGFDSDGETVYFPRELAPLDGPIAPWLLSATPSDNARDVLNDSTIELTFTEPVTAGEGALRLVNRDTGEVTEIDAADDRLVEIDGAVVTVTPPAHLDPDSRYAVEIDGDAFFDGDGEPFAGIDEGDTSTFNFTVSDEPVASGDLAGSFRDDLIRGGADDDHIRGRAGDDLISGGLGNDALRGNVGDDHLLGNAGDDDLRGGLGRDHLEGGAGNDHLRGGFGRDRLEGGAGDDGLRGGLGLDTFVYDGGHDTIYDFDPGGRFLFFFRRPGETVEIDIDGVSSFDDVEAVATQVGRNVVLTFSEDDTLTFAHTHLGALDDSHFDVV